MSDIMRVGAVRETEPEQRLYTNAVFGTLGMRYTPWLLTIAGLYQQHGVAHLLETHDPSLKIRLAVAFAQKQGVLASPFIKTFFSLVLAPETYEAIYLSIAKRFKPPGSVKRGILLYAATVTPEERTLILQATDDNGYGSIADMVRDTLATHYQQLKRLGLHEASNQLAPYLFDNVEINGDLVLEMLNQAPKLYRQTAVAMAWSLTSTQQIKQWLAEEANGWTQEDVPQFIQEKLDIL